MSKTSIEWTEQTWNPIVGCSIVSPGCTNCYAMKMAARIEAMGNQPRYAGTTRKVNGNAIWTGKLAQAPDGTLLQPLRRHAPTPYFVNSMGDLFHEDCPDEWIDNVFAVMALSPQHTFQVLTKRAARMRDYCLTLGRHHEVDRVSLAMKRIHSGTGLGGSGAFYTMGAIGWHFKNIWLGVSAERQQEADERIPLLLQTPAAVRFISAEPLLGPIDLVACGAVAPEDRPFLHLGSPLCTDSKCHRGGPHYPREFGCRWGKEPEGLPGLDWVIVGGESGPGARPMDPEWALALRDQCLSADVAFFFKQWGAFVPETTGRYRKVSKKAAGRLLDGIEHNGYPAVSA